MEVLREGEDLFIERSRTFGGSRTPIPFEIHRRRKLLSGVFFTFSSFFFWGLVGRFRVGLRGFLDRALYSTPLKKSFVLETWYILTLLSIWILIFILSFLYS